MEVIAKSKFVRQSPRKLRLVADQIRGMKVEEAEVVLKNWNKRAARLLGLVLKQGIGNAVNNYQLKKDTLKIKTLEISEGPRYKRVDKSHRRFRWGMVQKRLSHVRMVIAGEKQVQKPSRPLKKSETKKKIPKKPLRKKLITRKKQKNGTKN